MTDFKKGLEGIIALETEISYIDGLKGILEYRGYKIQPAVTSKRLKYLKDSGYHRAFVIISSKNYPALKAIKLLKFKKEKSYTRIKIFGIRLPVITRNCKEKFIKK